MSNLNYVFFDEYARLDKLCSELVGGSSAGKTGVTSYIDDMERIFTRGTQSIPRWTDDYRQLKHVRYIRNRLAHEAGAFEEKLCTQDDISFVKAFHERILNQTDPLAMLYKLSKSRVRPQKQPAGQIGGYNKSSRRAGKEHRAARLAVKISAAIAVVAAAALAVVLAVVLFRALLR
mgnify:CR=1 FL=1